MNPDQQLYAVTRRLADHVAATLQIIDHPSPVNAFAGYVGMGIQPPPSRLRYDVAKALDAHLTVMQNLLDEMRAAVRQNSDL